MVRFTWRLAAACLFALLALLAAGCGNNQEFRSAYCRTPVVIDGSDSDWVHALTDVEKAKAFIGVRNDGQYLYLCLECEDHATSRQIQMSGLTVWFDPEGGEQEVLGIHYPLGMRDAGVMPVGVTERPRRGPGGGGEEGEAPGGPGGAAGGESRGEPRDNPKLARAALREIEILGPGRDHRRRMDVSELKGIQVGVSNLAGAMIYELRIPLAAMPDVPYVLGVRPGAPLGVSFKTGSFDMRQVMGRGAGAGRPRGGGRRGGGGGGGFPGAEGDEGGGGGGPGGGRGGFRGGEGEGMAGGGARAASSNPIEAHIVVRLATDSTISH